MGALMLEEAPSAGTDSDVPATMKLGFEIPLARASEPALTPKRLAISERVSPACTLWVAPLSATDALPPSPPETLIVFPAPMRLGFEIPFARASALTVVPNR